MELWRLHHLLEKAEITEEPYYDLIKITDEIYFQHENKPRDQISKFIEELFPQLFEVVDR